MTYTAKSREELIEQVKEYLNREDLHAKTEDDSNGEYSLMYILTRRYSPEKTVVVASNDNGGVYMFYPYDKQEDFSEPWDFDADRLLFELLGELYEITYMSEDAHSDVWFYVNEMGGINGVWYKRGMQLYLDYCAKEGITLERMKQKCNYEGIDLMKYCMKKPNRNKEQER